MRAPLRPLVALAVLCSAAWADDSSVAVRVPETTAWVGQRVALFVDLRSPGPFAGTTAFDLPAIPGATVLRIGSPVVSSLDVAGRTCFVQTHEFALFSQRTGPLQVPEFSVRYACREGFTGPVREVEARVPGPRIEIRRPPGSEAVGFLVTAESLEVSETWDPPPGPARAGAVFRRRIVQRAAQVPGMALAPPPAAAPDGVRVYRGEAETADHLERGEFTGERRETISYLLVKPGVVEVPGITYVWFDPRERKLRARTLPAVVFDVAPAAGGAPPSRPAWPWLAGAVLAAALGGWQRRRVAAWARWVRRIVDPPERAAARNVRRACRRDDARGALAAWAAWRRTVDPAFEPGAPLSSAVLGLQRHLFGPAPAGAWRGADLARAFAARLAGPGVRRRRRPSGVLPPLNPDPRPVPDAPPTARAHSAVPREEDLR